MEIHEVSSLNSRSLNSCRRSVERNSVYRWLRRTRVVLYKRRVCTSQRTSVDKFRTVKLIRSTQVTVNRILVIGISMASRLVLALALCAASVSAYPYGPPVNDANPDLCKHMAPTQHHTKADKTKLATAQTTTAPYTILTSTENGCFKEGLTVEFMIETNNKTHWYFEGYFSQVQKTGVTTNNYGTFQAFSGDEYSKPLPCFNKTDSAMGHMAKAHFTSRKFKWTAPSDLMEDVVLRSTVVKNIETFWVDWNFPLTYNASCEAGSPLGKAVIQSEDEDKDKDGDNTSKGPGLVAVLFVTMVTAFLALALP